MRTTSRVCATALLVVSVLAGCTTTSSTANSKCGAVFFGAAGSGEGSQQPAPAVTPAGLSGANVAAYGSSIAYLEAQLVKVAGHALAAASAVDYPAAANYLDARGLTPVLNASEQAGATTLVNDIRATYAGGCSTRPILLAGYSQGAEVVIRAVDELTSAQQQHVTVALLGNPSYQPGQPGDFPGGTDAAGLRPTFLDGQAYVLPNSVRQRTLDVCGNGDPVCGVQVGLPTVAARLSWVTAHLRYHSDDYVTNSGGYTSHAAKYLWTHRAAG